MSKALTYFPAVVEHAQYVYDSSLYISMDAKVKRQLTSETSRFEIGTVLEICTAFGGPASHSVILARKLGIPAVVGLGNGVLSLQHGQSIILDGEHGKIYIDPDAELVNQYLIKAGMLQEAKTKLAWNERASRWKIRLSLLAGQKAHSHFLRIFN